MVAPSPSPSIRTPPPPPIKYPFYLGGLASCFAACLTHPLDLLKVRLQSPSPAAPSTKPTLLRTITDILRSHGPSGFYSGLTASLLRQSTYSTVRFGLYETLKPVSSPSNPASPAQLTALAILSGSVGGIAGNPADVINVRMQREHSLPASQRHGYRNALHGLVVVARAEGVWQGLFRGVGPNTLRAALMSGSQLASYDVLKGLLGGDGLVEHVLASLGSGVVATTVCSPADVVKTRVMAAKSEGGAGQGVWRAVVSMTRSEGLGWMLRGWVPSFVRLGPQTMLTFLALEELRNVYRRMVDVDGGAVVRM